MPLRMHSRRKSLSDTCSRRIAIVRVVYRPCEPTFFFALPIELRFLNFRLSLIWRFVSFFSLWVPARPMAG